MGDVAAMTWPLTGPGGPLSPAHRVRRCLFGRVDEETRNLDLKEYMNTMLQKNKLRWNFDFEAERPMPGQYNWKQLADDPADADSNGGTETQPVEEEKSVKIEQTLITDFMRKRKSSNRKDSAEKLQAKTRKTRRRSST